jgi:hypothetical protein
MNFMPLTIGFLGIGVIYDFWTLNDQITWFNNKRQSQILLPKNDSCPPESLNGPERKEPCQPLQPGFAGLKLFDNRIGSA